MVASLDAGGYCRRWANCRYRSGALPKPSTLCRCC